MIPSLAVFCELEVLVAVVAHVVRWVRSASTPAVRVVGGRGAVGGLDAEGFGDEGLDHGRAGGEDSDVELETERLVLERGKEDRALGVTYSP